MVGQLRRLFTTEHAHERGLTRSALAWGEEHGRWRRIERGVYGVGSEDPTPLDRARAAVLRTGGVACGRVAALLHDFDAIDAWDIVGPELIVSSHKNGRREGVRRTTIDPARVIVIAGTPCTDGLQTLIDLAPLVSDLVWECALEFVLRKRLASLADIERLLPELMHSRTPGTPRIRRVLDKRPDGAPATGSLLETLMVQLARSIRLPDPKRQLRIENRWGDFVAYVDLARPAFGLFGELDGEKHKGQPVYDSRRETAIVAATGWLCGRFTWTEVVDLPRVTARRLVDVIDQARRRPLAH